MHSSSPHSTIPSRHPLHIPIFVVWAHQRRHPCSLPPGHHPFPVNQTASRAPVGSRWPSRAPSAARTPSPLPPPSQVSSPCYATSLISLPLLSMSGWGRWLPIVDSNLIRWLGGPLTPSFLSVRPTSQLPFYSLCLRWIASGLARYIPARGPLPVKKKKRFRTIIIFWKEMR
jgi:hypothetical protein